MCDCVVVLCVLPVLATDCTIDSPSSSSPCCTLLDSSSSSLTWLVDVYNGGRTPPLCLELVAANTVDAQRKQARIDALTSLVDANECWGGHIAEAPGSGIYSLQSRQDYARRLQAVSCEAHFRVDGDWSGQCFLITAISSLLSPRCYLIAVFSSLFFLLEYSKWTACQPGNKTSTRSRACSNPLPAMGGANCTDSNTEQKPCPPTIAKASSTATNQADQSASFAGTDDISASIAVSSAVLVSFALPILCFFSF